MDPQAGDRIIEIGCVELENLLPTGRELQLYINPGRLVSEATVRITGITNDDLYDRPPFGDVVEKVMAFFGDAPIVAHNAEFDRGFLNAELARLGRPELPKERFIDTLVIAKEQRPGSPASLDAVCKRFNIPLEGRELHGALKDAKLLAQAYLELRGGRFRAFDFTGEGTTGAARPRPPLPARPQPAPQLISPEEAAAHVAFVATLGENAIWLKYSQA